MNNKTNILIDNREKTSIKTKNKTSNKTNNKKEQNK